MFLQTLDARRVSVGYLESRVKTCFGWIPKAPKVSTSLLWFRDVFLVGSPSTKGAGGETHLKSRFCAILSEEGGERGGNIICVLLVQRASEC